MTAPSLRILAVRPPAAPSPGGDEIVYRRTLDYLRRTARVDTLDLVAVGKIRKFVGMAFANPPESTRYISRANRRRVAAALRETRFDAVLLCNEVIFPMLPVAASAGVPVVLHSHNAQSVIARSDTDSWTKHLAPLAVAFDRRWYGRPGTQLVTISRIDEAGLREIGVDHPHIHHSPPGPPPAAPLAPDAPILRQAVLTGSFGWWRKRRDLRAFAAAGPPLGVPLGATDPLALQMLGDQAVALAEQGWSWSDGLRFGLIVDRFLGGFKLKSLEYVANNCVILSMADIRPEFEGLPHADEFVRFVRDRREMAEAIEAIARGDAATVARFLSFKQACLDRFDWDRSLAAIGRAVEAAAATATATATAPRPSG